MRMGLGSVQGFVKDSGVTVIRMNMHKYPRRGLYIIRSRVVNSSPSLLLIREEIDLENLSNTHVRKTSNTHVRKTFKVYSSANY